MGEFEAPVFIIAAPRSGSTLLYEALSKHPDFVSVQGESHGLIEGIPELSIVAKQFASNQLNAEDATTKVAKQLHERFLAALKTRDGKPVEIKNAPFRFLEKTPKNALRIKFLSAMYPDAKFVYLVREPIANISSIMDAWKSGRFVTYPNLPGWHGDWSLILPPGWQDQRNKGIASVATFQWAQTHRYAIAAMNELSQDQIHVINYERLISSPVSECNRVFAFAGLPDFAVSPTVVSDVNNAGAAQLPLSRYTLTQPSATKWHKHAFGISHHGDVINDTLTMINQFIGAFGERSVGVVDNFEHIVFTQRLQQVPPASNSIPSSKGKIPISRNAPCHCGSGKRYKHCHGKPQ